MNSSIGSTVILMIVHLVLMILYIANVFVSKYQSVKILSVACSILWGLCFVLDIIKLILM